MPAGRHTHPDIVLAFRREVHSQPTGHGPMSLVQVLVRTRTCQVTEPRDRVYSLLSLVAEAELIIPSYASTIMSMMTDIARLLAGDGDLSFLLFRWSSSLCPNDWPSWTPDLSMMPSDIPPWIDNALTKDMSCPPWSRKLGAVEFPSHL
jgi:hypothetical protein